MTTKNSPATVAPAGSAVLAFDPDTLTEDAPSAGVADRIAFVLRSATLTIDGTPVGTLQANGLRRYALPLAAGPAYLGASTAAFDAGRIIIPAPAQRGRPVKVGTSARAARLARLAAVKVSAPRKATPATPDATA